MATSKSTTNTASTSLLDNMDVEEKVTLPLRGRGVDPDVVAIRSELEKMLEEGTARSFKNIEKDRREFYARKIRAAGAMKTETHDAIKVSTRYDEASQKLIWGPESVLKALAAKR